MSLDESKRKARLKVCWQSFRVSVHRIYDTRCIIQEPLFSSNGYGRYLNINFAVSNLICRLVKILQNVFFIKRKVYKTTSL